MHLKFWGVRGSIPTPGADTARYGGNTTCLNLHINDEHLIIDSGTGIRKLGILLQKQEVKHIVLLITHSHWDHVQGFPFFAPAYDPNVVIDIYSCKVSHKRLKDILTNQMEFRYFPIDFRDLKAKINFIDACPETIGSGKASMSAITATHPGGCQGFKFEHNGKKLVFLTDNELIPDKLPKKYDNITSFCNGVDVLIHDSNFTTAELKNKHGWGHSSFEQAYQLAVDAKVKSLYFFHHDPERTDAELDKILAGYQAKKSGVLCYAATEGNTIEL
ncbi:MAG: MBL fold metallo-hydrolase [Elusimicrobiota bacterium]